MISSRLVATTRTDVRTAIALLLLAEATLCFTFLFIVEPITTLERLLPLAVVLVLCAALYWGQHWGQWGLLAPISFRVWKLVLLTSAAWGVGRAGTTRFLTLIVLAGLAARSTLLSI